LCNTDYQDFGKFNSLGNTSDYEKSVKYESFFVFTFYVNEATLRHVQIQGRSTTNKTMTCNF